MMGFIRHHQGYYGFVDFVVKKIRVLFRKIISFNQGRIVKLLASNKHVNCQFLKTEQVLPSAFNQACVERANQICAGKIQVLNNEFDVSDGIDWDKDYLSGFVWPKGKYFQKYVQVDLTNDADVKIPREISRFHFALALGLAYRYSLDEKHYLHFRKLILSWIEEKE